MWYIIIAIIVIVLLWSFVKRLFEFLLEHWQISIGAIAGFLCGGIGGAIAGVIIFYFVTFFLAWIAKCIRNSNEKKLKNYLKKNCLKLGYVTVEQLSEKVVQFKNMNYNTSFQSLLGEFLNESTKVCYSTSNPAIWSIVRGYLEQRFSYNQDVTSIDVKEIYRDCSNVFMWTRNVSEEILLFNAISDKNNGLFNNYEIQEITMGETKHLMISSLDKVNILEGENWG